VGDHPDPLPDGLKVRASLIPLLLLLAAAGATAGGQPESSRRVAGEEEIDHLGIAATMLRDGNYDRAEAAIRRVDPGDPKLDKARYYSVRGLIALQRGAFAWAAADLRAARENGQNDPRLLVYIAQAQAAQEDYAAALQSFEEIPDFSAFPEALALRAQCHWKLNQVREAFRVLDQAYAGYPRKSSFLRQRIFYLIELDLTRQAAEDCAAYLGVVGQDPEAWVTIGEALRRGGEARQAVLVLEQAGLRFPDNERVRLALAQAYLDRAQPFTAARLLEKAAAFNPVLYLQAAELYQQAGDYGRALYLNGLLTDGAEKARQRFSLLLKQSRFEEALALEPRLARLGLLDTDPLRYALAYALFRTRRLEEAAGYLNRIQGSEFFRQATQLRRAIEALRTQVPQL
jgi:tetratricopeptide (TPR) repeat protein